MVIAGVKAAGTVAVFGSPHGRYYDARIQHRSGRTGSYAVSSSGRLQDRKAEEPVLTLWMHGKGRPPLTATDSALFLARLVVTFGALVAAFVFLAFSVVALMYWSWEGPTFARWAGFSLAVCVGCVLLTGKLKRKN